MVRLELSPLLVSAAIAVACGSPRVPAPPITGHPTSALVTVDYPPPPARVEWVPERPEPRAVWIDGEWLWRSGRWSWLTGRWVIPPSGGRYAPWTTVRDKSGTLYLAAGAWRNEIGDEITAPPPLAPGRARPTSIVSPEGDEEPVGPTITGDAGANESRTTKERDAKDALDALDAAAPIDVRGENGPDAATMDGGT